MPKITFVMVEMNERLAQFMRSEQLTAAKLAEIVQVQPSSISHLLSGRNKPNFEFVSRLMRMFPELNPDWLINGMDTMYRHQQVEHPHSGSNEANMRPMEPLLFESKPEQQVNQMVPSESLFDTIVNAHASAPMPNSPLEAPAQEPKGTVDPVCVAPSSEPSVALSGTGALAGVHHVVVLFDDQTCVVYQNRATP